VGRKFSDIDAFFDSVPAGRPLCLWFGSSDPHRDYVAGSGSASGLRAADVVLPPFWPDVPAVREDMLDYYFEVQRFDSDLARLRDALYRTLCAEKDPVSNGEVRKIDCSAVSVGPSGNGQAGYRLLGRMLEMEFPGAFTLRVADLRGREVMRRTGRDWGRADLSRLEAGLYGVTLAHSGGRAAGRIFLP
jgi:hypothetical protein